MTQNIPNNIKIHWQLVFEYRKIYNCRKKWKKIVFMHSVSKPLFWREINKKCNKSSFDNFVFSVNNQKRGDLWAICTEKVVMNKKNTSKLQQFCIQLLFQCKSNSKQQKKVNSWKVYVFKQVFQSKSKTKLQEKVNFLLFSFSINKDIVKGKKT